VNPTRSRHAPAWWWLLCGWVLCGWVLFGAGLELYTRGDGAWQLGMPQPHGPHLARYVIAVTVLAVAYLLWQRMTGSAVWVLLAGGWLAAASVYGPFRPAVLVPLALVVATGATASGARWLASNQGQAWRRNRAAGPEQDIGEPPGPVVLPEPATVTVPLPRDQAAPAGWNHPPRSPNLRHHPPRHAMKLTIVSFTRPRRDRPRRPGRRLTLSRSGCSPR
jgi:hypothetical protein